MKNGAFGQVRLQAPKDLLRAERPAELHRFYVAKEWQGLGFARELMAAVMQVFPIEDANA